MVEPSDEMPRHQVVLTQIGGLYLLALLALAGLQFGGIVEVLTLGRFVLLFFAGTVVLAVLGLVLGE
jgi:hypothetical protein